MCVCTCVCAGTHMMCADVFACVGTYLCGRCLLQSLSTLSFRQGLSLNLELMNLTNSLTNKPQESS